MALFRCYILLVSLLFTSAASYAFQPSGLLEIHYINVGQGGSTLIIGPDGTLVLYDFGNVGRGTAIAKYLQKVISLDPDEDKIDFTFVSHRDTDHYGGYVDVTTAGFDVLVANFDSGSDKPPTNLMSRVWLDPASKTTAGNILPVPVGLRIPLGDGAEIRVVAANGRVFTSKEVLPYARNENDRSISLYVKYKNFDYVLDGDLGAGEDPCSDRDTGQRDFELPVAKALVNLGMNKDLGVDVLHIAHHGSESSTSQEYFDLMRPEVGLISVGLNQRRFLHPRVDVVEDILLGPTRKPCVKAPPLLALFQTDIGKPGTSSTGSTSFLGMPIGDIKLTTDGESEYRISGSGRTEGNEHCKPVGKDAWIFTIDDVSTSRPTMSVNQTCLQDRRTCDCALHVAEN